MWGPPPVDMNRLAPMLTDLQVAESLMTEMPVVLRDSMREVYYDRVLEDHRSNRSEVRQPDVDRAAGTRLDGFAVHGGGRSTRQTRRQKPKLAPRRG